MKEKGNKNKHRKDQRGDASYSESVRAKFCCAFKLSFLQLVCKASLIFKQMFKNMIPVILSTLVLK